MIRRLCQTCSRTPLASAVLQSTAPQSITASEVIEVIEVLKVLLTCTTVSEHKIAVLLPISTPASGALDQVVRLLWALVQLGERHLQQVFLRLLNHVS